MTPVRSGGCTIGDFVEAAKARGIDPGMPYTRALALMGLDLDGLPITKERTAMYHRLAAAPAPTSGTPSIDPDVANAAIAAFAKAVGLPPGSNTDLIDSTWDACLVALGAPPDSVPPPPDEAQARRMLSASELRAVDGTKGATAMNFLALKRARDVSERDWRKPLGPDGRRNSDD